MTVDRRADDKRTGQFTALTKAVTGLREDLTAYRWTLDRYLRRGTGAVVALVVVGLLLAVLAVQSIATLRSSDQLLEEMRRSEHDHRVRNELLHACLVDLVLTIVTSDPSDRVGLVNPCPDPLQPEELP